MAGESALYKKFRAEQDAADAAYKSWEKDQWAKNGAEWTKQGYTRTEDPSNPWGSKWGYNPTGNSSAGNGGSSGGNGGSGAGSGAGSGSGAGAGSGSAVKVEDYSDLASSIQTTINNAQNLPSYTVGSDLFGTKSNTPWGGNVSELVRKNAQDRLNNEERLNSYNFSSGKDYLSEADLRNHFHREFADNLKNKGVKLVTNYQGGLDADWLRKQADYDALYQRYKNSNTITTIGDHVSNFFGGIGDWFNRKSSGTVNRNVNPHAFKQGGTMNKIKYFSQGGAPTQTTQNQMSPEQELKAAVKFLQDVQAGNERAITSLQQIQAAAKKGVPEAQRMMELLAQASKMMKSAKWGSKLEYIRSLKFAKGGKSCPVCEQQKVEMKKCGGKKAKKRYFGGYL